VVKSRRPFSLLRGEGGEGRGNIRRLGVPERQRDVGDAVAGIPEIVVVSARHRGAPQNRSRPRRNDHHLLVAHMIVLDIARSANGAVALPGSGRSRYRGRRRAVSG